MPMRCWGRAGPLAIAALAALTACAGVDAAHQPTVLRPITVAGPAGRVEVKVSVDPALIDPAGEHRVKPLGTHGRLTLVLDSYASRPQSMSRCQAGSERYVRLLDLAARAERYSKLVESCLRDVVPGEPPAAWSADGRSVTVTLLSEPSAILSIGADGQVTARTKPA